MARNLRKFNTYNDYETAELIRPAVSLVVSPRKVYFDPINPTPPVFEGKWKATYSDSHTESAECDSSSAITHGEITLSNLVSVEIGDNCVTSIGNNAFNGCTSLTSVTIGSGVTRIDSRAFQSCSSLTSIDIPSGVTSIGGSAFYYCNSLTSIDIPDSVTSIGYGAFRSCRGLTSIDIPSGVTSIGTYAFNFCDSLTSITVEATTPPTIDIDVFLGTNNCPILVPSQSLNAYRTASGWSDYADRIQPIPNS